MIKDDRLYLEDIIAFIDEIELIAKQDRNNIGFFRGIERNLAVLGEAANKLSSELKLANPQIPWRDIIDLRNLIVHGYDAVKPSEVWDIVDHHVPRFKQQIEQLLQRLK